MNCEHCNKELYEYNFLSLRKYEKIDDDEYLIDSHDFCSEDCANKFKSNLDSSGDFELFEIRRCVGYYDCEKLDNLRGICENEKRVSGDSGLFGAILPPLGRMCEPAQVGIIRASLKLLDIMDNFDKKSIKLNKEMLKHTKSMNTLTKFILFFTIANAVMIIAQIIWSLLPSSS